MNVETKYSDRAVTVEGAGKEVLLTLINRSTKRSEIAYLTDGGAHALADWIKANVPEPKPAWHDAKDGEAWLIKIGRGNKTYPTEMAAIVKGRSFFFKSEYFEYALEAMDSIAITAVESARRIWPAPEGDTNA